MMTSGKALSVSPFKLSANILGSGAQGNATSHTVGSTLYVGMFFRGEGGG